MSVARFRKVVAALFVSELSEFHFVLCKLRRLSLVSFLRSFGFSGLGSKAEGDTAGGVDMTEGDLVNRSEPKTRFTLSFPR